MGRFAWTQGHSKQPSDRSTIAPDWFSKASGEPSRQALSDLIKEKSSSPPGSTSTRSRTNTVSSIPSKEATSVDYTPPEATTRPPSRQSVMEEAFVSPPRHDRMSKHFLSKGTKMMRRQTSKLNALTSSGDDRASGISRVRSAGHLLSLHSKRTESRPQISGPYDFQHVSHTNKCQYESIAQDDKTDLADSFTAMQADQQPGQEIIGIPVSDLPSSTPAVEQSASTPPSPTFSIVPSLPSTPPAPAPPPKDHLRLPSLGGDVRMSRSMENFSWPNRSPLLESELSFKTETISEHAGEAVASGLSSVPPSPEMPTGETGERGPSVPTSPRVINHPTMTADILDKPLPQPPTVVHAVSTSDDSTLMMKVAPLPQVPQRNSQAAESPKSERVSSTPTSPKVPSGFRPLEPLQPTRLSRRRSQSSSYDIPLASHFAPATAAFISPPRNVRQSKRISIGIKKIDIDDWEDAIDYSWDHAFDAEDDMEMGVQELTKSDILPQTSSFGAQRTSSALQLDRFAPLPTQPMRPYKSDMDLQGLGIASVRPQSGTSAGPEYEDYSEKHESLKVPFIRREPGSPISKSSSQESIILSIASSIMSTHRSSNSSTSLGDMSQLESIQDEPEGALPPEDCKPLASASGSVSSSETVTTDKKSAPVETPVEEDKLEELPAIAHQRGASASRVPFVPNRTSSVASGKSTTRQRSSTMNSGRRVNPRASYSLFPVAGTTAPAN